MSLGQRFYYSSNSQILFEAFQSPHTAFYFQEDLSEIEHGELYREMCIVLKEDIKIFEVTPEDEVDHNQLLSLQGYDCYEKDGRYVFLNKDCYDIEYVRGSEKYICLIKLLKSINKDFFQYLEQLKIIPKYKFLEMLLKKHHLYYGTYPNVYKEYSRFCFDRIFSKLELSRVADSQYTDVLIDSSSNEEANSRAVAVAPAQPVVNDDVELELAIANSLLDM